MRMNNDSVELRKQISFIMNESKRRAKQTECIWCGKRITSFCNSHSVPQCVLKNITVEGKVDYFNSLVELPGMNIEKGLNEAGTFKLLCRECDSKLFQEYEDIDNLGKEPTQRMLAEIAYKNVLVMLNKRYIEIEQQEVLEETLGMPYIYDKTNQLLVKNLDIRDYGWELLRTKNIMDSDEEGDYYRLIYWKKLDYVIPIAFQGPVALYGDLNGKIVVDIYDNAESTIVKNMHVCLFPLKTESVVFLFYHREDQEYDAFAQQFNSLSDAEKLQLIGYIIFEHCEDMLFAQKFPHRTWMKEKIRELFVQTTGVNLVRNVIEEEANKRRERYRLKYRDTNFPNILDSKFAFQKE